MAVADGFAISLKVDARESACCLGKRREVCIFNFELDIPYLAVILFFSAVGYVYFSYGKKMNAFWFMLIGITLMFYGYMMDVWYFALLTGSILSALPFILSRYL
ncbi:hypothetical protein N9D31_01325 [Oligoflexaceae bacterium]|nr:hypothetical protein [Oligoflexaceae bacterium]